MSSERRDFLKGAFASGAAIGVGWSKGTIPTRPAGAEPFDGPFVRLLVFCREEGQHVCGPSRARSAVETFELARRLRPGAIAEYFEDSVNDNPRVLLAFPVESFEAGMRERTLAVTPDGHPIGPIAAIEVYG